MTLPAGTCIVAAKAPVASVHTFTEGSFHAALTRVRPSGLKARQVMFVGVSGSELMARVGPATYEASLAREFVREMDFTGRPMKGFVFVGIASLRTERQLASWLDLALAFNPDAKPSAQRRAKKTA